jgi:hypothetical protein
MNNRRRCITSFAFTIAILLASLVADGSRNASAGQAPASTPQAPTARRVA